MDKVFEEKLLVVMFWGFIIGMGLVFIGLTTVSLIIGILGIVLLVLSGWYPARKLLQWVLGWGIPKNLEEWKGGKSAKTKVT